MVFRPLAPFRTTFCVSADQPGPPNQGGPRQDTPVCDPQARTPSHVSGAVCARGDACACVCALGVRLSVGQTCVYVHGLPVCAHVCPARLLCGHVHPLPVSPSVRVCVRDREGGFGHRLGVHGCVCPIVGARIPDVLGSHVPRATATLAVGQLSECRVRRPAGRHVPQPPIPLGPLLGSPLPWPLC